MSKKATLHVQHTFLYISLLLFCTTTAWNFKELPGYSFMEEMSHVFLFIFFHCCSFSCTLVATSISYFPTATTKFQQKNVSFVFYLSLFFLLSFAGLLPTFSFSLSLSFSVFQICGHNNIYLSKLNTLDNTDTETISAFRFHLYWLF